MKGRVLVSGASIAGPALAFWLARHGFAVTLLERAPAFRDGGQNIDVRGAGRQVLQRMGLEGAVAARNTGERGVRFVDAQDRSVALFDRDSFGANGPTAELEILRGDLARLLFDASRGTVETIFGDRICAVENGSDAVTVTLERGGRRSFDLLLVAEGIGSATRRLVFGAVPRRPFDLYLGYFTIPKGPGDGDIARWYNAPGGRSVFLRPDRQGHTRALLGLQHKPAGWEDLPPPEQKRLLQQRFADAGWEVPRVLAGMAEADDFYFESIGQIRMPRWSAGRVALVGDAGYAPAPVSGMGTSLALVGAYVLAGELARQPDRAAAFARYESLLRPYVHQGQAVPKLAPRLGIRTAAPRWRCSA